MENFPGNSYVAKNADPEAVEKEEPKLDRVEKIVIGKVSVRKKPLGKRFVETFFSGTNTVWSFVLHEVILPAAKDTLADAVTQSIERALFGESRSTSRRTGTRPGVTPNYVSYNRYHPGTPAGVRRDEPRTISRRARASHDFQEIVLATRPDAEAVIDKLFELISKYNQATVSDLYDLVGIQGTFTDEKWGWRDLRGAGATRITAGYLLDLPTPEALD